MKAYVIAIEDHELSQQAANRCIKSGETSYDYRRPFLTTKIEKWKATTPDDKPLDKLLVDKVIVTGLMEKYSRLANCAAAFHSHFSLWKNCVETNETHIIFEHDAVIIDTIPDIIPFDKCISLGKPSYGKFNTPTTIGINPLMHKRYFGGAHAYMIKPIGAKLLIDYAVQKQARPTDVFLNVDSFPWLQEYYPWPVEARDSFTTIQNEVGCYAKHNYGETYRVSEV